MLLTLHEKTLLKIIASLIYFERKQRKKGKNQRGSGQGQTPDLFRQTFSHETVLQMELLEKPNPPQKNYNSSNNNKTLNKQKGIQPRTSTFQQDSGAGRGREGKEDRHKTENTITHSEREREEEGERRGTGLHYS